MFDFVIYLLLALGILIAFRIYAATNEMVETNNLIKQALQEKYIVVKVEKNEDGVFAYRFRSGEFLAHGHTFEIMVENFRARFPGKTGLIANIDGSQQEI